LDIDGFVASQDLSSLNPDQIKSELAAYGVSMKNKANRKLYERILLEIYTYTRKGKLPDYL
jgi:hypothetical protein